MVLSHVTAAVAHDVPIWDLPLDEVHLTRTDGARVDVRQASFSTPERSPADHVVLVHGVPVTSPARTAFDVAVTTDVEHCLCVVNDLLHRKLVTRAQLERHQHRRWPAFPGRSASISRSGLPTDAASRSGSHVRSTCSGCIRCPAPELQYKIYDEHGRLVAVVDFAWPELGVFVEFDGQDKYERLPTRRRVGHGRRTAGEEARSVDLPAHRLALPSGSCGPTSTAPWRPARSSAA